ncbi:hypothetical protein IAT38_003939 [Cryptococcus sp. DSM 104549]
MSKSPERQSPERKMSVDSVHSRPAVEEEPAAKRPRTDVKKEDKARGKRLFGNLLGTLQQFKKDDKSSRVSEAAKRREEVAERIAKKLRSETKINHDINEADKELKSLKAQTEHAEFTLKQKDAAMSARHALLKPTSKFLHTKLPLPHQLTYEPSLLNPSPIPLAKGPAREPPAKADLPPLYFLPKIPLPHQETVIKDQIANITELISEEAASLAAERENVIALARKNRDRIDVLHATLHDLRKQVSQVKADPDSQKGKGEVDELGRERRGSRMSVDGERGSEAREEREGSRASKQEKMDVDKDARDEKEKGVQIHGEDGDIEVEY